MLLIVNYELKEQNIKKGYVLGAFVLLWSLLL
jgi:hypothetical protein